MNAAFISVQEADFEHGEQLEALRRQTLNVGAVCTFTGLVREFREAAPDSRIEELFLEHYPGMTEKCLAGIVDQAFERWELIACRVIHRVGRLQPGDQIVYVGTASEHRGDAFAAAEFIMDYLKTEAPFWKRQTGEQGTEWVEQRNSDEVAARRWRS